MGSLSNLSQHPFQQFKKDRRFYLRYDTFYLALCTVISALMLVTGFRPVTAGIEWRPLHFVVGVPVVGLAGDWNLLWHYYRSAAPLCDLVLTDARGVEALARQGIRHARVANIFLR